MTRLSDWELPRRVWTILLSWGLAVLALAGLLSWRIWLNDQKQDEDMCSMISVFLSGPEPVPGPEGDRSRVVRTTMAVYYDQRDCERFRS